MEIFRIGHIQIYFWPSYIIHSNIDSIKTSTSVFHKDNRGFDSRSMKIQEKSIHVLHALGETILCYIWIIVKVQNNHRWKHRWSRRKKGPSLAPRKNPKLCLGLELPHSLFVLQLHFKIYLFLQSSFFLVPTNEMQNKFSL